MKPTTLALNLLAAVAMAACSANSSSPAPSHAGSGSASASGSASGSGSQDVAAPNDTTAIAPKVEALASKYPGAALKDKTKLREQVAARTTAQNIDDNVAKDFLALVEQQYAAPAGLRLEDAAPADAAAPTSPGRGVVGINDSVSDGPGGKMYTYIDMGMKILFDRGIAPAYDKVKYLGQGEATWPAVQAAIVELASDPTLNAVDVVINLHGGPDEDGKGGIIAFNDGVVNAAQIEHDLIAAIPKESAYKLRMVYNQACYGATQMQGFVRGGFKTASGTEGEHSTGFIDYPSFVSNWTAGNAFANTLGPQGTISRVVRFIADWKMRQGNSEVNNNWQSVGDASINIDTVMAR